MNHVPPLKPLPAIIIAVLALFIVWPAPNIKASSPFQEDFDAYSPGDLSDQGEWIFYDVHTASSSPEVENTVYHSSPYSAKWTSLPGGCGSERPFADMASGSLSFMFYSGGYNGGGGANYPAFNLDSGTGTNGNILFRLFCGEPSPDCFTLTIQAWLNDGGGTYWGTLLNGIEAGQWNYLKIDFNAPDELRLTINASTTGWYHTPNTFSLLNSLAVWTPFAGDGYFRFYIDDIGLISSFCSLYTDVSPCLINNCYWKWGIPTSTSYCTNIPGGCGNTLYSCFNCHSTSTCLANSSCYWLNSFCHFGSSFCGPGFPQIEFCTSSSACVAAGGYWYDSFCWDKEQESFLSCTDYYSLHSSSTPTDFYLNTCSSSAAFLGKIGGVMAGLSQNFDLEEAAQNGMNLGSAIPLARAYLEIIDQIFGNLPVAELLIFVILFLLALGLFKLFQGLAQIFKFW
jgi:hypothetical protein